MRSWYDRYNKYENEVRKADKIRNVMERKNALAAAEKSFDLWMDQYPTGESNQTILNDQKSHDQFMNQIGLHPKNSY